MVGSLLEITSPAMSIPGMSGLIRATLPSARVARPSLKLTLDQPTLISISPSGRSAAAKSTPPRRTETAPSAPSTLVAV
jgi:hypothetical protein